jgi:hypothetical protein
MSNNNYNTVQNALPQSGVPGTGLFSPTVNVVPNTYNTPTGKSDSPYNTVYIGDSPDNIVGSSTTPYLPMALPSYIPTLYENMYQVQTNLKNQITDEDIDNREYPTIFAVKQYVNTQLQGFEYLVPPSGSSIQISTTLTTSFLTASQDSQSDNVQTFNDSVTGMTTYITTYNIKPMDSTRNGAEKVCINTSPIGRLANENITQNIQIVLSDPNQSFVVNGQSYKCYVPASLGDTLNMFQFINPDTSAELFFVLSYGGLFSGTPYYV